MNITSLQDLAVAATANLVVHAGWVHQHTPGMSAIHYDDLVVVDSGLPCDTFNLVCRARLAPDAAPARIRTAIDHFAQVGRPFSWWLCPGDQPADLSERLLAAGLQPAESALAMSAGLDRLQTSELPANLQIRRVRTPAQLHDFAQLLAAGAPPDPQVLRFYALAAPALLAADSPLWLYVGYLEEIPVATAEATVAGGVVGLYNIVTLAAYRRRGFGSALTLQPLLDAHAQGHRTAVLQAAADGVSIYTRIGFAPFGQITEYTPAPASRSSGSK
jgi:ribosomal protein S18 acetylase RimI-like enzyme